MKFDRMKSLIEKINIKAVIVVLIVLSVIPILYLSFYSLPSLDDFDYSTETKALVDSGEYNIFNLIKAAGDRAVLTYNTWNGHYIAAFFMALQPGIFGDSFYFITVWIFMAILFFSFIYSGKKILSVVNVDNKTAYFLSLLIFFFYFQTMPSPKEGLFWFNGAINYIPFFCLSLIVFAMLLDQHNKTFKIATTIMCSVFSFVVSGGNPIPAFFNILMLLVFNAYILVFSSDKKKIIPVLLSLFAAIVGFLIMVIAPGNANRQAFFPEPSVIGTITASITGYFASSFTWLNLSFFLFLFLLTPFVLRITKKLSGFKFHKLILLFMVHFMLVCGILAVPYHGMRYFGEGRATNIIYAVDIITLILVYSYAVGWAQQIKLIDLDIDKAPLFVKKLTSVFCSIVAIIGVLFFGSDYFDYSTTVSALDEISRGVHIEYQQEMTHRNNVLRDPSISNPVFEPIQETSVFFGGETLVANKWDWPNGAIAQYYGKESVALNVEEPTV